MSTPAHDLSAQEIEIIQGVIDAHRAVMACVRALREFGDADFPFEALSAEQMTEIARLQAEIFTLARTIGERGVAASVTLRARLNNASDRGLHYRGLNEGGKARVVVRR